MKIENILPSLYFEPEEKESKTTMEKMKDNYNSKGIYPYRT